MINGNRWNNMGGLCSQTDRAFEQVGFHPEPFFPTAFLPGRTTRCYLLINLKSGALCMWRP